MPQNLGANHPLQTPSTTTTLSSSAGPVNISFSFINDADVLVFLGGTLRTNGTGSDNYTINTAKTQVTFNNTVSGDVVITRKSDLLNKVRTFTAGSSVRAADLNTQFDQVMQLIQDNYELLRGIILNDGNDEITVGRDSIIANDKVRTESIQDNAVTLSKIAAGNANQVLITSSGEPTWSNDVDVQGTLDVTGTTTLDGSLNVAGNADLNGALDVDGDTELDDVNVSGTLDVAGNSTFDGDVDLGNSAADTITITGEVDSNIVPSTDGSRDLGSSTKRWNEVHADNIQATTLSDGARVTASEQVAHVPNDTTYYTTSAADQRFWRQDAAGNEVIQTSTQWTANDSRVATTGAIDARIVSLVTEVGGFVPIANETSFPATNPDINDGAGTIVSIGALASDLTFNGSGQATITDGAGSGNNVTITGGPASTTIASNSGALVETTTTLHTYTWHRTTPDGANVNTVANSIANVNTVANNIADVNALEDVIADIQTLADIEDGTVDEDAISDLAAIASNVTTCADNIADINTVANDLNEDTSEIEVVAGAITNVNNVGGSINNVNTVATNINNVNSFSQTYQVSSSAPGSPDAGDLWWDTSQDPQLLKAYDATNTQWVAVTTDQEAGLQTSGGTMTGALILDDGRDQTAPVLTFDGDSNTGIFSSGADSVDVTANGATRLQVTGTAVKSTLPTEVEVTTTTTNAVTTALTIESQSSNTPAAGIGVGMDFAVETAANNVEIGAQVEAVTTDVSNGGEDVDLVVNLMEGGAAAAEKFRVASDGDVTAQGSITSSNSGNITAAGNLVSTGGTVTTTGNTNLTLTGAGSGKVIANDALDVAGNLDIINGSNIHTSIDQNGSAHFNQQNGNADFRIDGDNNDNVFFVDASADRVGIGTATPKAPLHIVGPFTESTDSLRISTGANNSNTEHISIGFDKNEGDTNPIARIGTEELDTNDKRGHLYFETRGVNSDSAPTERMRITSAGELLVGANAQTNGSIAEFSKSVGAGATGCHITVENTSTDSVNNTAGIDLKTSEGRARFFTFRAAETVLTSRQGGTSELHLRADGDTNLRLFTNGNERMRINGSGDVGIGETSPDAKLHIRDSTDGGSGNTQAMIQFSRRNGGANDAILYAVHDGSDGVSALRFDLDGSERFRIDDSGNATVSNELRILGGNNVTFHNADNSNTVRLDAADCSANYKVTLPPTAPTADNQVLSVASGTNDCELQWQTIATAPGTGGGSDEVFIEHGKNITTSYSISANTYAHTVGDMTIDSGATVTIPSTSTWFALS